MNNKRRSLKEETMRQLNIIASIVLFMLVWDQNATAQGAGCNTLTFSVQPIGPCHYRLFANNQTPDCYQLATVLLPTGYFGTWTDNTASGWAAAQTGNGQLELTHANGNFPAGSSWVIDFYFFDPGASTTMLTVLFDNLCIQEGCANELVMETCEAGCISGVKYRECDFEPYSNQPTLTWIIELCDAAGNPINAAQTINGMYSFCDLPPGNYTVKEVNQLEWVPNIPPSGSVPVTLAPGQNAIVNFGNCPVCSCDAVQLHVQPILNDVDFCCYRLITESLRPYCFDTIDVHVDAGLTISNWNVTAAGWTVKPINGQHIQVIPPQGHFIPEGFVTPITFCVAGLATHHITAATSWSNTSSNEQCLFEFNFDCSNGTCQNNFVQNGNFEQGTPTGLDETINLALYWKGIWANVGSASTGDFYNTVFAPPVNFTNLVPAPAFQGNYAAIWCKNNFDLTWREGIMNQLGSPIAPNTGNYYLSAKIACLTPVLPNASTALPRISVFGVPVAAPAQATPPGATLPLNKDLFTPPATNEAILLGTFTPGADCDKNYQTFNITFNSSILGNTTVNRIFLTREDGINHDVYLALDDVCLSNVPPMVCNCGVFSNLYARPDANEPGVALSCGQSYTLDCPKPYQSLPISGRFACQGNNCPASTPINWTLTQPSGNTVSGTAPADPFFVVKLMPLDIAVPGNYSLSLQGICGSTACPPCNLSFTINCPNTCPCDPALMQSDVAKGFADILFAGSCKACFSPLSLNDCDVVEWLVDGTLVGTSTASMSFCHVFPGPGVYSVTMSVLRKKSDGSICTDASITRTVDVSCGNGVDCDDSVFGNPGFGEGAVAGGLNSGGNSTGWQGLAGNPVVMQSSLIPGSYDGWMIYVSGYTDTADVVGSTMPVCVEKGSGTISVRLFGDPIPGVDIKLGRKWRSSKLYLYSGDTFSETAPASELWFLGEINPPAEDNLGWMDVRVPFDMSGWSPLDSCGDANEGVLVRVAIQTKGSRSLSEDGPDSGSGLILDNLCIEGQTVSFHELNKQYSIRIHPNPTTNNFTVELPQPTIPGMQLRIAGIAGNTLLTLNLPPGTTTEIVPSDDLPGGIYFLQILADERVLAVRKLVKL